MSYVLMAIPNKRRNCRVVKSKTIRFSWKKYHDLGFRYVGTYPDWQSSQIAFQEVKSLQTLNPNNLQPLRGCWKHLGEPTARKTTVRWSANKNSSHFVYGLYHLDKLVYIGVTSDPYRRRKEHWKSGKLFDYMEVLYDFNTREEADAFEIYAIDKIKPPLNRLLTPELDSYCFTPLLLEKFGS